MSLILAHSLSREAAHITHLEETTGTIQYFIRLNPDVHSDGFWRECSGKDYFTAKQHKHFGGMVETKTAILFYGDDENILKELEI